jgi:hypothetical protein
MALKMSHLNPEVLVSQGFPLAENKNIYIKQDKTR